MIDLHTLAKETLCQKKSSSPRSQHLHIRALIPMQVTEWQMNCLHGQLACNISCKVRSAHHNVQLQYSRQFKTWQYNVHTHLFYQPFFLLK